jgi:hypothetical protein
MARQFLLFGWLLCMCELTACARLATAPSAIRVTLDAGANFVLPPMSRVGVIKDELQSITFEAQGRRLDMLCQLQINLQSVTVVGLSPIGNPLFTLTYDQHGVNIHGLAVDELKGEMLIADILMTYLSPKVLQSQLQGAFLTTQYEGEQEQRVIRNHNNIVLIEIIHKGDSITYTNYPKRYRLDITRIEEGAE